MTGQFEQDVKIAVERFLDEIRVAAEHVATEAIRSVFMEVASRSSGTRPSSSDPVPASSEVVRRRARTPARRTTAPPDPELAERLVAHVRANPGSTNPQLCRSLGIGIGTLQLQLDKLRCEGAIRSEDRKRGFRMYEAMHFVVQATVEAGERPADSAHFATERSAESLPDSAHTGD